MTIRTLLAATALSLSAGAVLAQEHTFRFQSSDPAGNPNFQLQQQWAESVAEMSDGAIEIDQQNYEAN